MALERVVKPHVLALEPYQPGKPIEELERELGIAGAVKLASNESPLGPSPRVVEAIRAAADDRLNLYPDPLATKLREAAAPLFGVEPDWVLPANGSDENLTLILRSFVDAGELVAFPDTDSAGGLAFRADGQRLAVAGSALRVFDVGRRKVLNMLDNPPESGSGLALSADGSRVAFTSADGLVLTDDTLRRPALITRLGKDVQVEHEASVSRIGEEQLFYLMSRGLTEAESSSMIVSGFIEPLIKELPMEYAVEMNRLIELQMEGSVG